MPDLKADVEAYMFKNGVRKITREGEEPIFVFHAKSETERKGKDIVAVITAGIEDRAGDVVNPNGCDLKAYEKNPVILWAHDYTRPPIGKALWTKIDGNMIKSKPKFNDLAFSQEIKSLYDGGDLNAWSIGFRPTKTTPIYEKNDEGEAGKITGYRFDKWELLEYSAVPVPACSEALTERALSVEMRKALSDMGVVITEKTPSFKYCVCPECGYAEDHVAGEPCQERKCPECGVALKGANEKGETKPGWDETDNEIRFRLRDPEEFDPESFRTVVLKKTKPRIDSVMGKLKGEDTMTKQNLMFPKEDDWTLARAKEYLAEHPELKKAEPPAEWPTPEWHVPPEDAPPTRARCVECGVEVDAFPVAGIFLCGKCIEASIIDDIEVREGRVLSTKNLSLVTKCRDALSELIAAASREENAKLETPEATELDGLGEVEISRVVNEMLSGAIEKAIRSHLGKID